MITVATIAASFPNREHPEGVWMGNQSTTVGLVAALSEIPDVVRVEPMQHAGMFIVAMTDPRVFSKLTSLSFRVAVRDRDDIVVYRHVVVDVEVT